MAKRYKCEYVSNNGCIGSCNKEDRLYTTESDLCAVTNSVYDGLPVRCVGQWAEQKIYWFSILGFLHKECLKNGN